MNSRALVPGDPRQRDIGLAILRVVTGVIFAAHGWQKLFVFGISGVQGAFAHMGVPLPVVTGPLIGVLELFGGIAVVLGLLTRPIALLLACDMLGAIILVHSKNGFFLPTGIEFVSSLCAGALALVFAGPGGISVDAQIAARHTDRTLPR